jgi:capsular polysaccharide transport system permease protein
MSLSNLPSHDAAVEADPIARCLSALSRRDLAMVHDAIVAQIERTPDSAAAWAVRARILKLLGEAERAIESFERASTLAPDSIALRYRLGRLALANDRYGVAHEQLTEASRLDPANKTIRGFLGIAQFRAGDLDNAADSLARAQSDGVLGKMFKEFAVFVQTARLPAAKTNGPPLLALIAAHPGKVEARVWYAHYLEARQKYPKAQRIHRLILALKPDYFWSQLRLGLLDCKIAQSTDDQEALAADTDRLERIADGLEGDLTSWPAPLVNRSKAYSDIIDMFVRLGRLSRILPLAQRLVANEPDSVELLSHLGNCQIDAGLYDAALNTLEYAKSLDQSHNELRYHLAMAYHRTGHGDLALQEVRVFLEKAPHDHFGYVLLSEILLDRGEVEAGELALQRSGEFGTSRQMEQAAARCSGILGRSIPFGVGVDFYRDFDGTNIRIPEPFRPSLSRAEAERNRPPLWHGARSFWRVVFALIQREVLTRFAGNHLGYLWAILQPTLYVAVLYVIFAVKGRHVPSGMSLLGLLLTGVVSFQMFSRIERLTSGAMGASRSLFYFRQITFLSIITARFVLEFLTNIVVFTLLSSILWLTGTPPHLSDPMLILWALFLLCLLGAELGLLISITSLFFPALDNLNQVIRRTLFFVSGVYFYANELPHALRTTLLYNPIFNCIEAVRVGFYTGYYSPESSIGYAGIWALGGLFVALTIERLARKQALED